MPNKSARSGALMLLLLAAVSGCSKAPQPDGTKAERTGGAQTAQKSPPAPSPMTVAAAPDAQNVAPPDDASRVIAKTDVTEGGKPTCKIDFVYAGSDPEDLYWDGEGCSKVTALLVNQAELEKLGKWQRLDAFEKRFVNAMPGGKVLYVEGGATASIYPVGTTNMSYEVTVAD